MKIFFKANEDFLQILLNTLKNGDVDGEHDNDISHEAVLKHTKKAQLEELEIVAQSFLFLVAGYETTATTLQFIAYELAMHPEIQEQCHQQIVDVLGSKVLRLSSAKFVSLFRFLI
jgi:cytochrome P450